MEDNRVPVTSSGVEKGEGSCMRQYNSPILIIGGSYQERNVYIEVSLLFSLGMCIYRGVLVSPGHMLVAYSRDIDL